MVGNGGHECVAMVVEYGHGRAGIAIDALAHYRYRQLFCRAIYLGTAGRSHQSKTNGSE